MATIFTRIINGELPARFVWRDEQCVAFLSIQPLQPGHVLVVPRQEVDHWIDLDSSLAQHLITVAQSVAKALQAGFKPTKVGLVIVGLEVPHCHIHVVPIHAIGDLNFANQDLNPKPADLDQAADTIRKALRALRFTQVADR